MRVFRRVNDINEALYYVLRFRSTNKLQMVIKTILNSQPSWTRRRSGCKPVAVGVINPDRLFTPG